MAGPALLGPGGLKQKSVSIASNGDNTVVAGKTGQTIVVYDLVLAGATATAITVKDGASTTLEAASPVVTSFVRSMFPSGHPRYTCSTANDFVINLGAANSFTGSVWYQQY